MLFRYVEAFSSIGSIDVLMNCHRRRHSTSPHGEHTQRHSAAMKHVSDSTRFSTSHALPTHTNILASSRCRKLRERRRRARLTLDAAPAAVLRPPAREQRVGGFSSRRFIAAHLEPLVHQPLRRPLSRSIGGPAKYDAQVRKCDEIPRRAARTTGRRRRSFRLHQFTHPASLSRWR